MEAPVFSGTRVGNFSPQGVAPVAHADDAALIVQFYLHPVRQGHASQVAGRDIFKDEEYIWIRFAGDRTKEIRRPVDLLGSNGAPPDPERFPKAWMAFKNSGVEVHEGTPLEEWPIVGKSTAMNLKGMNVHTVENLAAVSDAVLHNLGTGGRELRDKAQAWLKAAKDASAVSSMQAELAKRDEDIAALKQQLADLAKSVGKKDKAA